MSTMPTYDPDIPPNADAWLALDEQKRIDLAEKYHRTAKIKLPDHQAHAIFHAIIENQIALGVPSVVRAIPRLMKQGLSRHDAIHAVGSVLGEHIYEQLNGKSGKTAEGAPSQYDLAVDRLNASDWLAKYDSE